VSVSERGFVDSEPMTFHEDQRLTGQRSRSRGGSRGYSIHPSKGHGLVHFEMVVHGVGAAE
jgi:hypothetical protein